MTAKVGFFSILLGCILPILVLADMPASAYKKYVDEINTYQQPKPKRMKFSDVEETFRIVTDQILPDAVKNCEVLGKNDYCSYSWAIGLVDSDVLNAYAYDAQSIIIHSAIIENAESPDEIAMVIAHEIGHHAHNHINSSKNRAKAGAIFGGLIGAVTLNPAIIMAGAQIGVLAYSAQQEKQADNFAIEVLVDAGYEVGKARQMMLKLARKGGAISTSFLDSHPSGPERLYFFDRTVSDISHGDTNE